MNYATLEIEQAKGVATIWMNRPELHNAFNPQLIDDLTSALGALESDAQIRVLILAGRGKSFSSGADLNWMKAAGEAVFDANFEDALKLAEMLRRLAGLAKPTIARVHGSALGGGMGLAAACDICVASVHASFATSEAHFGLIPSVISPYVLRAIGPRQSLRYFQTGERISAARALEIGLVHEAVDIEHLDAKIARIAESLVHSAPGAAAAAKRLVHDMSGRPVDDESIADTARRTAQARSTEEAKEGLAAFLEKRLPKWCD